MTDSSLPADQHAYVHAIAARDDAISKTHEPERIEISKKTGGGQVEEWQMKFIGKIADSPLDWNSIGPQHVCLMQHSEDENRWRVVVYVTDPNGNAPTCHVQVNTKAMTRLFPALEKRPSAWLKNPELAKMVGFTANGVRYDLPRFPPPALSHALKLAERREKSSAGAATAATTKYGKRAMLSTADIGAIARGAAKRVTEEVNEEMERDEGGAEEEEEEEHVDATKVTVAEGGGDDDDDDSGDEAAAAAMMDPPSQPPPVPPKPTSKKRTRSSTTTTTDGANVPKRAKSTKKAVPSANAWKGLDAAMGVLCERLQKNPAYDSAKSVAENARAIMGICDPIGVDVSMKDRARNRTMILAFWIHHSGDVRGGITNESDRASGVTDELQQLVDGAWSATTTV